MNRQEPNWIAFACGIAYILCFLFLPFYRIMMVPVSGLFLLQYINPIMTVLLIAGILLAIAAWVLEPKVSLIAGIASFLLTLGFALFGNAAVTSGNGLAGIASSLLGQLSGVNISPQLWVAAGVGGVLCMIFSALHPIMELLNRPRKRVAEEDPDFFS